MNHEPLQLHAASGFRRAGRMPFCASAVVMKQVRVLMVDDNAEDRRLFLEHVGSVVGPGLDVRQVPSAYKAMEVLRTAFPLPHAVVVDLSLGVADEDGHSLARDIRSQAQFAHIPVFTISSDSDRADYEKDPEGRWLKLLAGVIIHAAASARPGPLELLHEDQVADRSRIDGVEAALKERQGAVQALADRMDRRDELTDARHAELIAAINQRPWLSQASIIAMVMGVVTLGIGGLFVALAWRMDLSSLQARYRDLQFNANSETLQSSPVDASPDVEPNYSETDTGPALGPTRVP